MRPAIRYGGRDLCHGFLTNLSCKEFLFPALSPPLEGFHAILNAFRDSTFHAVCSLMIRETFVTLPLWILSMLNPSGFTNNFSLQLQRQFRKMIASRARGDSNTQRQSVCGYTRATIYKLRDQRNSQMAIARGILYHQALYTPFIVQLSYTVRVQIF